LIVARKYALSVPIKLGPIKDSTRWTQRGGVSSAKTLLRRGADDWLCAMCDGSRVITLIDQFDKVLELAGITHNSHGDKYTLYSLQHFYAMLSLRRGIGVFDVARNMGTSVQVIQNHYSKHYNTKFIEFVPWRVVAEESGAAHFGFGGAMLLDLLGPAGRCSGAVADFHFSDIPVRGDDGARAIGANDDVAAVEQRGRRRQHP